MSEQKAAEADETVEADEVSEAQIAVHWKEEEYIYASPRFVSQAIMTDPALIPGDIKRKLEQFYGKYWRD